MPRSGVPQNGRVIATTDPLPGDEPRAAFARLSREGGGSGERGPRYVRAPRAHNRSCPDMCPDPRCYLCISHHETSLTSAGHVSRSQMRPRNNQVVRVELTPPNLAPAFKFAESLQQANITRRAHSLGQQSTHASGALSIARAPAAANVQLSRAHRTADCAYRLGAADPDARCLHGTPHGACMGARNQRFDARAHGRSLQSRTEDTR